MADFSFLGWQKSDSRWRVVELTLTTPTKISWKTDILLCCVHDCDHPHIYIPLFWPDFILKTLCHTSGLTWLWDLTSLKPSIACLLKKIIVERIWVLGEALRAKVRISLLITEIMKCVWLFQSDLHITFWMERSKAVYWQIVYFKLDFLVSFYFCMHFMCLSRGNSCGRKVLNCSFPWS